MTIPEQISAKELEIHTLTALLEFPALLSPKLRRSDLCVQRSEAMAALNTLRALQVGAANERLEALLEKGWGDEKWGLN